MSAFKMGENILSLLARKPLAAQYIVRKSVSDMGPNIWSKSSNSWTSEPTLILDSSRLIIFLAAFKPALPRLVALTPIRGLSSETKRHKSGEDIGLFISNFLLFLFVLFILGLFIKENGFTHNFLCLSIIGQGLNIFDLFIVDLLWWRNTKRVRLRKMPEKELYQNPKKHIEAFIRAFIMYLLIALIDGYILTLL